MRGREEGRDRAIGSLEKKAKGHTENYIKLLSFFTLPFWDSLLEVDIYSFFRIEAIMSALFLAITNKDTFAVFVDEWFLMDPKHKFNFWEFGNNVKARQDGGVKVEREGPSGASCNLGDGHHTRAREETAAAAACFFAVIRTMTTAQCH